MRAAYGKPIGLSALRFVPLGAVKSYFTSGRPTAALFLPSLDYRLAQEEPMNSPQGCSFDRVLQLRAALRADSIFTSRDYTSQHSCSARLRRAHWALRFTARPARRCEVLLPERTACGRIAAALARLSSRSGGAYEQPTGLFI